MTYRAMRGSFRKLADPVLLFLFGIDVLAIMTIGARKIIFSVMRGLREGLRLAPRLGLSKKRD